MTLLEQAAQVRPTDLLCAAAVALLLLPGPLLRRGAGVLRGGPDRRPGDPPAPPPARTPRRPQPLD